MDDTASQMLDRSKALADFDHARDDFEAALSAIPEDALDFRPEGEDYSLRDLVPHLGNTLMMYTDVLNRIEQAEFQEVRLAAEPDNASVQRIKARASTPLRNSESTGTLDELDALHDRLAGRLRDMAEDTFARQAPVFYPGSESEYPTAAYDIIKWVSDHYREHTLQVAELLEKWNKEHRA